MKKRLLALLIAALTLLTAAIPAMAATPDIKKVEYEGAGYVEVDFKRNVQYKNARISVKDDAGHSYTARIKEKDDDDLTFHVKNIQPGKTYSYVISGVRSGRSGAYANVSGSFDVPAAKQLSISGVEYDADDRELEIEFSGRVQYKKLKVAVKDADGKSRSVKILDKDSGGVEARVKGLTPGKQYTVTVSGVALKGSGRYGSINKIFTAVR